MNQSIKLTGVALLALGLSACALLPTSQTASVSTSQAHAVSQISNAWGVTDTQALAWLTKDDMNWTDKGQIKNVNWYNFWSQQLNAKTGLAQEAYQYCHSGNVGSNCQTFFQASSMTSAQTGNTLAQKIDAMV